MSNDTPHNKQSLNDLHEAMKAGFKVSLETPVAKTVFPTPFTALYRNWRGETAIRNIIPTSIRYGATEWHKEPQWLLVGMDVDKGEEREFALRDFSPVHVDDMFRLANEAGQAAMREKAAQYVAEAGGHLSGGQIVEGLRNLPTVLEVDEKKVSHG